MKRVWSLFLLTCLLCALFACAPSTPVPPPDTEKETPVIVSSALQVYFLSLGKADCILLRTKNHLVVIDTGEKKDGDNVVKSMELLGASKIDALILSHPDKDHIGGAAHVIGAGLAEAIYFPDVKKDSKEQTALDAALAGGSGKGFVLKKVHAFTLDGVKFTLYPTFLSPVGDDASNDSSIGVLVEHGNNRLFFAGDATGERLNEMVQQIPNPSGVDLLKVPHHGRFDSHSDLLIHALTPKIAIICCSHSEPPDKRILALLNAVHADQYQTGHGLICVTSDGNALHVDAG